MHIMAVTIKLFSYLYRMLFMVPVKRDMVIQLKSCYVLEQTSTFGHLGSVLHTHTKFFYAS